MLEATRMGLTPPTIPQLASTLVSNPPWRDEPQQWSANAIQDFVHAHRETVCLEYYGAVPP